MCHVSSHSTAFLPRFGIDYPAHHLCGSTALGGCYQRVSAVSRHAALGAVRDFGNLSPDNAMTQEEIIIIAGSVVSGAPQGNAAALPKPSSVGHASATAPLFSDAVVVQTRAKLVKPTEAAAIKPLESRTISSAKLLPGYLAEKCSPSYGYTSSMAYLGAPLRSAHH